MSAQATSTVDPEEVERFSRLADEWWDAGGKFKPLHEINAVRLEYITSRFQVPGSRILDIGCGGGLVAEPLARLGAKVTGIDASEKNIAVAKAHAAQSGLEIDYRCASAESLVVSSKSIDATNDYQLTTNDLFDVVLALEIVEHVANVEAFVSCCAKLVRPGGIVIFSTLNRTLKSLLLAKIGAEYVLRWVPAGTHAWDKFLKPSELIGAMRRHGLREQHMTGMAFDPFRRQWKLDEGDVGVNYLLTAQKMR